MGFGCNGGGPEARKWPSYVRTVDRVVIGDVERVIAARSNLQELVELTSNQRLILFDGSKDTCLLCPFVGGGQWQPADELIVVFNEAIQAHEIQVTKTLGRSVGTQSPPMVTDILGDFEWAYPNPTTPNGFVLNAYSSGSIGAKVSAFSFLLNELADSICEIVVKTFTHNDIDCNCP